MTVSAKARVGRVGIWSMELRFVMTGPLGGLVHLMAGRKVALGLKGLNEALKARAEGGRRVPRP